MRATGRVIKVEGKLMAKLPEANFIISNHLDVTYNPDFAGPLEAEFTYQPADQFAHFEGYLDGQTLSEGQPLPSHYLVNKRKPTWEEVYQHLVNIPQPSLDQILGGSTTLYYAKAVYDFMVTRV